MSITFIRDPFLEHQPWAVSPWVYSFVGRGDYHSLEEAHAWCHDQFGGEGPRWRKLMWRVEFRDQVDATAFRIRWG